MNAASGPEYEQGGDVCSQFKLGFKPNYIAHSNWERSVIINGMGELPAMLSRFYLRLTK
jgi:hypothetical protein